MGHRCVKWILLVIVMWASFLPGQVEVSFAEGNLPAARGDIDFEAAPPPGIDLDVTYISRDPHYDWDSAQQWPELGDAVVFTAHIINKGTMASGVFEYKWLMDGQVVESGLLDSTSPQVERTSTLNWLWQTGRHTVSFRVDPQNLVVETAENNNQITDFTDAMAIGFWVEESVYNEFNNKINGDGTYSWEDWAQSIVRKMNQMLEQSRYPQAPQGGLSRVRLDKITMAEDDTLFNLFNHAPYEYATDVQWGFSIQEYQNCSDLCFSEPWWVIHELMHYLYARPDIYAFTVAGGDVKVRDDSNHLIAGTPALPYIRWDVVYYASRSWDLLHNPGGECLFSDYVIYSLNTDWPQGERTHRSDWDYYLYQLPVENKIRILNIADQPLANVQVWAYQAVHGDGISGPYSKEMDNIPDIVGTTDAQGLVSLGSAPFGDLRQYGTPAGVLLLKLYNPVSGQTKFTWLELTDFNIAAWQGKSVYIHDVYFPNGSKQIKLSSSVVTFRTARGINPVPQEVKVSLVGDGVAEWTASLPAQSWLRTIPSVDLDTQFYQPGPLTFVADSADLPVGTYTSQVSVSSPSVTNSPRNISIILHIIEAQKLYLPLTLK